MTKKIKVVVTKNNRVIKIFEATQSNLQTTLNRALNFAGGKYDGLNSYKVKIKK